MTIRFAYIHCKPDGTPFYVGKGSLRRAKYLGERNPHHKAVVAKYGAKNISKGWIECSNDETAFELEKGIIKCLRRMGVILTNFTDGGEGGKNPTEETRHRLSEAAKKRGVSEKCHQARIAAKKGKPLSEEQKQKQSEAMKGKKFTEEHRRNISISAKKRGMSEATIQAARQSNLGRKQPEAEKQRRAKSLVESLICNGRTTKVRIGTTVYPSMAEAARYIGTNTSAVLQALRRSGTCKGYKVEYYNDN